MSITNYVKLGCHGRETRMFELPTDMETIKKGFSAYRLTDEYQIFRKIRPNQLIGNQSYWKKTEVGELHHEGKYRLFLSYPKINQEPIIPPEKYLGFIKIHFQRKLYEIPLPTNKTEIKKACGIFHDANPDKDFLYIESKTEESVLICNMIRDHTYYLIDRTQL